MLIGIPQETFPGERRVALVPAVIPSLKKAGFDVLVQSGAGAEAGYTDASYQDKGAAIAPARADVFRQADVVLQVLGYGSNDRTGRDDLALLRPGQVLIGFMRPLGTVQTIQELAATGATVFSIELMPRITRAQSMDALSSMATICGYKAVLLAADTLPRVFPMLTTAAGTITPARVFVIGAGVVGLQAIATARRLGAVVSAYDVRAASKEQVQSVGGRFVELPIEAEDAEDRRGYAKAQDEGFYQRQRELLGRVVAESDVVITAAVVPGRKSPVLVTREMVQKMAPGSVIVDCGLGARGQLRTDAARPARGGVRRHPDRLHQPGQHRPLSRQPDVRPERQRLRPAPVPRRQTQPRHAGRDHAGDAADARRSGRQPAGARVLLPAPFPRRRRRPTKGGCPVTSDLTTSLYVFVLAGFIGFEVIRRVSPLLHTPLMSLTNALDAIAVVGAIVLAGEGRGTLATVLGTVAVVAATSNVVGGFLITDRMLGMFKASRTKKP